MKKISGLYFLIIILSRGCPEPTYKYYTVFTYFIIARIYA